VRAALEWALSDRDDPAFAVALDAADNIAKWLEVSAAAAWPSPRNKHSLSSED
jgi:hypothetical protein